MMTEVRRSLGEVCFDIVTEMCVKITGQLYLSSVCYKCLTTGVLFGQIPIVENEIKKETGEVKPEDEVSAAPAQKLVTEMGTYVTQSALSSSRPSKKEEDR